MSDAGAAPGAFRVEASADEVAAFRKATGLSTRDETLPVTFPIRWMASPEARAVFAALVPERDVVLVHEAQTFDYAAALRAGETYTLRLRARRETAPDRLIAEGSVADRDGVTRMTLETILRLFPTARGAA